MIRNLIRRLSPAVAAFVFAPVLVADAGTLVFTQIGGFPDTDQGSKVAGISGDGQIVCGSSVSGNGEEAFTWTFSGGMTGLGDLPNSPFRSSLNALNTDGATGAGLVTISLTQTRGAKWVQGSGFTSYAPQGGSFPYSDARDISGDGSKLVGASSTTFGPRAMLWSNGSAPQNLGVISVSGADSLSSLAEGISNDGSTVVGTSQYSITQDAPNPENLNPPPPPIIIAQGSQAFFWRSGVGITSLGDLAGGTLGSGALGVSGDGSIIVGYGTSGSGQEAVVWSGGTPVYNGDLAGGGVGAKLNDITPDGSWAVGQGTDANGQQAVIWDATNGMRRLRDIISAAGIPLGSWKLQEAVAISDDGDVIVGNGINPNGLSEGWMISGIGEVLNGGTPSQLRYPIPVYVKLDLAPGLSTSATSAKVIADSSDGRREFIVPFANGSGQRDIHLLNGTTHTITARLGSWDGQHEEVVPLGPPATVSFTLDGDSDGDGLLDSEEAALGTSPSKPDTDNDGLNDFDEVRVHLTNPLFRDSDGDRALDGAEVQAGTDPLDRNDWPLYITVNVALARGIVAASDVATVMVNSDPYTVQLVRGRAREIVAVKGNADYMVSASMGALTSGEPVLVSLTTRNGGANLILDGDSDNDGLVDSLEGRYRSNPNDPDTDGDGIEDGEEVNTYRTYPNLEDSDRDGLNDWDEINVHLTNPLSADTDRDRATDGAEIEAGTDPLDPAERPVAISVSVALARGIVTSDDQATIMINSDAYPVTLVRGGARLIVNVIGNRTYNVSAHMGPLTSGDPVVLALTTGNGGARLTLDGDADSDGLADSLEGRYRSDPNNPDSDGDGIPDGEEVNSLGTNPALADTDRDGFTDPQEVALGTDPRSARSVPEAFIERQVEMDLGLGYLDLTGVYRDEHVDTAAFANWISTAVGSPRTNGQLWMRYSLSGGSVQWFIRGDGDELDVTRWMRPMGLRAPASLDFSVTEPHTAGDPFLAQQTFAAQVAQRRGLSLAFTFAGKSSFQSSILPNSLRVDLADATGASPYQFFGSIYDPATTGTNTGILYGNVDLGAEQGVVQGADAVIERQATMNLGMRYLDAGGAYHDEPVTTGDFVFWITTAVGSPRTNGELWMQRPASGGALRWLVRGNGPELDVTRWMGAMAPRAPATLDQTVIEPHTPGDPFVAGKSISHTVAQRRGLTLSFAFAGQDQYQSLTLPGTGLRLDLAEATGAEPFQLTGVLLDPNLTGYYAGGLLYGNVNLGAEEAVIQGVRHTLP